MSNALMAHVDDLPFLSHVPANTIAFPADMIADERRHVPAYRARNVGGTVSGDTVRAHRVPGGKIAYV